ALTLIVRLRSLRLRFASSVETGCVCLHALSSFQRTDRPVVPGTPGFPRLMHDQALGRPCLGEPSKVTRNCSLCQLSSQLPNTRQPKQIQLAELSGSCARI